MQRRDILKGAALSSLASAMLANTVAAVAQDTPDSAAAKALAELQQALDQLEVAFASPAGLR
jgi:TorA maturation chaperone TorD